MKTIMMNVNCNLNNVKNSHRYDSISTRSLQNLAGCTEPEFKGYEDWSIKTL